MRLKLKVAIAAFVLVMVSTGAPEAGAVSGPAANENSKFVYTEEIVATDLVLNFDEGAQKRFASVDYELNVTVTVVRFCGGQGLGSQRMETATVTLTPDAQGRTGGGFTIDSGTTDTVCACGCGEGTLTVDYTDMNLASSHVYRLDPISQTYTT